MGSSWPQKDVGPPSAPHQGCNNSNSGEKWEICILSISNPPEVFKKESVQDKHIQNQCGLQAAILWPPTLLCPTHFGELPRV